MVVPLPGSEWNQTLTPLALRGPSQILSIACACAGVRQFGSAEVPPLAMQTALGSLAALYLQTRGSSMMPSVTPSSASQAAVALLVAKFCLAVGITPPVRSFMTICPHICAVWNRVQ